MTPYAKKLIELMDGYTQAVASDTLLEFFGRIAAQLVRSPAPAVFWDSETGATLPACEDTGRSSSSSPSSS